MAVIVTHPFEFLKWSGSAFSRMRPNRLVQRRLNRLCAFLAENGDQFDVVPIDQIARTGIESEPAITIKGGTVSSTLRAAENFVNDRLPF